MKKNHFKDLFDDDKEDNMEVSVITTPPSIDETDEKRESGRAVPAKRKKTVPRGPPSPDPVPEFADLINFCLKYMNEDIELKQFYRHASPSLRDKRGGGGWVSPIKNTLAVLRKMRGKKLND